MTERRSGMGDRFDQDLVADAVVAVPTNAAYMVRIEHIANDSPEYQVYRRCARQLAKRAASGTGIG